MSDDDYTRIIIHGEGANNSTAFYDTSRCHRTIYNSNVVVSTTRDKWGNGSAYFNGSSAYLYAAASPDMDCGTLPFTMGVWGYKTGGGIYATLFGTVCGSWKAGAQKVDWGNGGGNVLAFNTYSSGYVDAGSAVSTNTWHYIEIYRDGTTIGLSIDGGSFRTATISSSATFNWGFGGAFGWGAAFDGDNQWFAGYMQDFRFVLGTVLHTSSFTPPSRLDDSSFMPDAVVASEYRRDILDGGGYRIAGTVDRLGANGSYRVRLFNRYDGRLVRECWSNSDGTFSFDNIAYRNKGYVVIAEDNNTQSPKEAAISDFVTPTLMV